MEPPLNMAVLEEFYPKMGTVISNFTPEGSPIWAFRFKKMDTMDLEKGNLEEWNPVRTMPETLTLTLTQTLTLT
jgi:hypothetical protein